MSTLNQAFLRAYTRDRHQPSGGPHLPATEQATEQITEQATHTVSHSAAHVTPHAAPHIGTRVAADDTRRDFSDLGDETPTEEPVESATAATAFGVATVATAANVLPVVPVAAEPMELERARTPELRIDPPSVELRPEPRPTFVPAWEVDQLPWPEVADQMSVVMGPELYRAVERWHSAQEDGARDKFTSTGIQRGTVVAVTSLIRREGRSSIAAGLARAAADEGLRVALLDADLENPRLTAQLELQLESSWVESALNGTSLVETAVRSVEDGLTIFPLTGESRMAPLSWSEPRTIELFDSLRQYFDLVVADLGPLTEVLKRGLQGGTGGPLDGTILLRDVRITGADQVLLIARELHQAGLNVVGVVDNFHESDGTWRG